MSATTEMSWVTKFPYQRLGHEGGGFDDYDEKKDSVVVRSRNWFRFKRVPLRKRFKLKVPSLRRFLRKVRLVSAVKGSCGRVMRRLKESQAHFGDLFAGNYLFVQVNPSSLKCLQKGHDLIGLSSRYSLPRVV